MDRIVDYIDAGRWLKANGFDSSIRFARREDIWRTVACDIQDKVVLHIEFGVARGGSIQFWSKLLGNPRSALHGFDSFEGLPEDWKGHMPRGALTTGGRIPEINDSRVRFFKGWFSETLPLYSPPPHERVVINVDCDLYSSATCVFHYVRDLIRPGAYIHLDDLFDRAHVRRAFEEFRESLSFGFKPVGYSLGNAMFVCTSETAQGLSRESLVANLENE